MYVTCNMTDVRCNCSMGDGEGEQASNPFVASAVVTQHPWLGFFIILKSFLVSRVKNSNKISDYLISTELKTLISGKWAALSEECTCLLCWTGRHQTQNGLRDHRKENPEKWVGICAMMATRSQRAMANTWWYHQRRELSLKRTVHFEATSKIFPSHNTSKQGCRSQGGVRTL